MGVANHGIIHNSGWRKSNEMKLHIYLFRHGETYFNKSKRFTGWINSRLTPKGREQSEIIAEKLRKKTFNIAARAK